MRRSLPLIASLVLSLIPAVVHAELSVGAAIVDVTPQQLPVLVNGGMLSRTADQVKTSVNARAVVISDGDNRIALVVVDSCMMPRVLLDDAKQRAASRTGLRADQIMISATHTHTAPSSFGALGTDADLSYVPFLREKIVEAIEEASARLQPARVGWSTGEAAEFTALRRWVRRPDRIDVDPFGNRTVRANMHAAKNHDDVTGPSGPEDPTLSMIAFESTDGTPLAVLCNFSMHYFGDQAISADYFGLFCDGMQAHLASLGGDADSVVAIMSHGCSGDIWRRDYMKRDAKAESTIEGYTQGLLEIAKQVYQSVEFEEAGSIAMAESRLNMDYRLPDAQRLAWANEIVSAMKDGVPTDRVQVYAREQLLLDELRSTEVVVQALRIGDVAIATTPNETYALTGLKLKLQSPLEKTMVIELANGADGYIPPPEQHRLGGYNTWAARSAGLEVQAEPRIVAAGLKLLEQVTESPRRPYRQTDGPAAKAIIDLNPLGYWRLDEMQGPVASDHSGNGRDAFFDPGTLYFLEGPAPQLFVGTGQPNRSVHLAGGRVRARVDLGERPYSVVLSFWNGMPAGARPISGWLLSRDYPHGRSVGGEHLGVTGSVNGPPRLLYRSGRSGTESIGTSVIERWRWYQIALVRESSKVRVHLDGNPVPEIIADCEDRFGAIAHWFFGGSSDNESNWEGRIDEVALFDRPLSPKEIESLRWID